MGISRIVKGTALAAAVLLMGVAAVACGGNGSGSDSLIPQRATLVGSIDLARFLGAVDGDLEQVSELFSSDSLGGPDGLSDFFDGDQFRDQFRSGGLFSDVVRADIFGEVIDAEDGKYFGALLHGRFDESELIAKLESISGRDLLQEIYKGNNVYSPAENGDKFMLSVLDGDIFAVGTAGAVKDIIDIWIGDADPALGPLIDLLNEFGDGIFALAARVPEDIAEGADLSSIPQLAGLPISLDFISDIEIVGLGGVLDSGSLDLTVTMDFTGQEAAESLEGFISGIATLVSGFSPDQQTTDLLAGLEIDRDGRRLSIKVGIPLVDLSDLLSGLTTGAGAGAGTTQPAGRPPGTPASSLLEPAVGDETAIMPSADHVPEGRKVEYSTTPPTSGDHWARWADCGWYLDGLPDEVATHNLEHGNIVVSYNFTNPAQVTELRRILDGVAVFEEWGVARSYDKIPGRQVALAAWGRLAIFEEVTAGPIELFFEAFAGRTGPERIPC